jgi:hypothetical protein
MTKKTKPKKPAKKPAKKAAKQPNNTAIPYDERMPDICIDGDEHTADPYSFSQADGAPWIVDVRCSKCKRSGAAPIEPSSIQW